VSDIAACEMPTADEIFGRELAPAPWPSSRPVLALVVEVLPTIEDELAADLLEYLALALVDRDDELRAVRAVLSSALALTHTQHAEIVRLRQRLHGLIDARRRERTAA
jgi:hypothetical protein